MKVVVVVGAGGCINAASNKDVTEND